MWVDFTMTSASEAGPEAMMHFVSAGDAKFDASKQMVELTYTEPSEEEKDIEVQVVIFPESFYIFRTGTYSMEQNFDINMMTTGELVLPEGKLELQTTTTKYERAIDFEKKCGNVELVYKMFIQDEYSGEFKCHLKFYDEKESRNDSHSSV